MACTYECAYIAVYTYTCIYYTHICIYADLFASSRVDRCLQCLQSNSAATLICNWSCFFQSKTLFFFSHGSLVFPPKELLSCVHVGNQRFALCFCNEAQRQRCLVAPQPSACMSFELEAPVVAVPVKSHVFFSLQQFCQPLPGGLGL